MASRSKLVQTKGAVTTPLLAELRSLIEQARQQVAQAANSALTLLYWQVGDRIRSEVLREGRAAYGKEIFATVSQELVQSYGKGFSASALSRMVQFSENRHERAEGEAQPIGLILCASADAAQVELLDMDSANIRVAKYTKQLPDQQVLQAHLHRAVALARARQVGKLQDQAQGDKRHGD